MPQVLLIMTKNMQKNYQTFGQSIMFDITYKVCSVAVMQGDSERFWNVGLFATSIEDLRPVICGICFILNETENNFKSLFLMLYEKMG